MTTGDARRGHRTGANTAALRAAPSERRLTTGDARRGQALRERLEPRTLPTRDYLSSNVVVGFVIQLVLQAIVAGLAISRAQNHHLNGTSVAVILVGGALVGALLGSLIAYVGGVFDVTAGRVLADDRGEPAATRPREYEESENPLAPGTIWRRALVWAAGATGWGLAVAFIIVAALDGRSATYPVMFAGLLAVSTVVAVASNILWRATGVGVARSGKIGAKVTLRRRAWLDVGLPLALLIGGGTAFFTWVLFHDYAIGDAFAARVLTEKEIFADLLLMVLVVGGLSSYVAGQLARADVRLGHVRPDDPETQVHGAKVTFGPQAIVYTGLATFVLAAVVRLAIPAYPSLVHAIVARGLIAALVAWAIAGLAYVRRAGNEMSL